MLRIKDLVTPSPEVFQVVIKGMRLPFKSGSNYDSIICDNQEQEKEECYKGCPYVDHWEGEDPIVYPVCKVNLDGDKELFVLGEKDKQLLLNLCSAGDPSHRKVLRQLPVIMDIKAPLYWWKQMDKYQVSTVTNAESTMHCLTKELFKLEDFSIQEEDLSIYFYPKSVLKKLIRQLNEWRFDFLETKDERYWYAINELLPQSYNQTRCWSGNYEVLINIINQRSNHKLSEWHTFCEYMLENVPYLKEIYKSINGSRS